MAMNEVAKSLVDGSSLLEVKEGNLRPTRRSDRLKLEQCIAGAVDRNRSMETAGGAIRIDDFESGVSLSVIVSPLPGGRQLEEELGAVIYISDGRAEVSKLAQERLQSLWGLTPAEARVAATIVSGVDLKTHASQLGISEHTARFQLKQAMAKTGSRRQSELTRLVLLGPAYVADPAL